MHRLSLVVFALLIPGCGGGPASPGTAGARQPLSGVVFYDENGNGQLDGEEAVRLPGVTVNVGDRSAVSGAGGSLTIPDAPAGRPALSVPAPGLPPYFTPGRLTDPSLPGPPGFRLLVPLTLPIGDNHPDVFMAFGDSLTTGEGSSGERGYLAPLAERLDAYWGRALFVNEGVGGTRSDQGAARLGAALSRVQPAWVLVDYGTNDWDHDCRRSRSACVTLPSLQAMVRQARTAHSLPVLATLLPEPPSAVDPEALSREAWVEETNDDIRSLARAEGVPLADAFAAFNGDGTPAALYADRLHPNDRGYAVMAEAFFRALTRPAP